MKQERAEIVLSRKQVDTLVKRADPSVLFRLRWVFGTQVSVPIDCLEYVRATAGDVL